MSIHWPGCSTCSNASCPDGPSGTNWTLCCHGTGKRLQLRKPTTPHSVCVRAFAQHRGCRATGTDHANAQVDPPYCIPPADHTPSKPSNVGRVQRLLLIGAGGASTGAGAVACGGGEIGAADGAGCGAAGRARTTGRGCCRGGDGAGLGSSCGCSATGGGTAGSIRSGGGGGGASAGAGAASAGGGCGNSGAASTGGWNTISIGWSGSGRVGARRGNQSVTATATVRCSSSETASGARRRGEPPLSGG